MRPRNRHGTPVDPVPFLVVALLAVTVSLAFGPPYLMELGVGVAGAVAVSGGVAAAAVAVAYHRYVWTARPDLRGERPVDERLRRLFYAIFAAIALLALLALPLLVRRG